MAPQRFLIIGSNSFTGASFVARLLADGCEVFGISRSPEPHDVFLPYKWAPHDRFRFRQLDLNNDIDEIDAILRAEEPTHVVNFAAQSMVAESWEHPEHWFSTNVVATVRLHDRLRRCRSLEKYVHVSTPEVYGHCTGLIREDAAFNPSTPYAVSRAATDMSLKTYLAAYRFPVAWTRAANVYGAGQQLYRIIPRAVLSGLLGRPLQLHGGGGAVRSFVHARDVADATLRIARRAPVGEVYHIATQRAISIRELVATVFGRLGADLDSLVEVVGDRLGKDAAYLLDSEKLRKTLGWQDTVSLEDGIDDVIDWARTHLGVLRNLPFEYQHKA